MGLSLKFIFTLSLLISSAIPKNLQNRRTEQMEGSFNILSYNVGGLPEIISSSNMKAIISLSYSSILKDLVVTYI